MDKIKNYEAAIIIPCKNEGIYIKQTLEFLYKTEAKNISNILIIDDGSNDNCCQFLKNSSILYPNVTLIETKGIGAAAARNLGASSAPWAKILIFCDAHITMQSSWLNSLLKTFDNNGVSVICPGIGHFSPDSPVGYGQTFNEKFETYWLNKPTTITEIPLAPGGCMAIRKDVFDSVGGFDHGFHSWGFEDIELSLKLWLFGYKLFVHPGVKIGHKFRKIQPYNVDLTEFLYNKMRMAYSHFNENRINKLMKPLHTYSNYETLLNKISTSDTYIQRSDYFNRRKYDDDWFFNKFHIPF